MCAIIGISSRGGFCPSLVKKIFIESSVRGLHATGVAFFKGGKVNLLSLPTPVTRFPFDSIEDWFDSDGSLKLIGHCRYSTSDLDFNQPLLFQGKAIVHNGVVTQEDPSLWNVACETRNDSELLLHSDNPLRDYPNASIAAILLSAEEGMQAFRNGKRPLHISSHSVGDTIVTSTRDIATRSGLDYEGMLEPGVFMDMGTRKTTKMMEIKRDLQRT